MNKSTGLPYVLIFVFTMIATPLANSAELRPLNLPSTQRQYTAPAQAFTPPAPAKPTVYDRFRTQVEGLNEEQRNEYRSSYQSSLTDAEARGDQAAAVYYRELLNILN